MFRFITDLSDPELVARFQKFCGVEYVEPGDSGNTDLKDCSEDANCSKSRLHNNNNIDADKRCASNGVHQNDQRNGQHQKQNHHKQNGLAGTKSASSDDESRFRATAVHKPAVTNSTSAAVSARDNVTDEARTTQVNGKTRETAFRSISVRYPLLYYWARVGAFLGNEEFYLTGLPFLIWTVDSAMIRQVVVVWWLVMYLGQAGKDYFSWPRPYSPPVVRLETTHLAECSMPSTHAMAGTAIPLTLATVLLERYELPTVTVVAIALLWCVTTCLSRLYLGVHSVLDISSGCLTSVISYVIVFPLTPRYDLYQQTHPLAPIVLIITSLALCTICYPSGPGKNTAKFDAITTTSVFAGLGIGSWLNYQLKFSVMVPSPVRIAVSPLTFGWLGMSLLQFVVGVVVIYSIKAVLKKLTIPFFSYIFGLDRPDRQHPSVMVGYTYTTYMSLGLVISFLNPLLFTWLGFGRPTYYLEVL